MKYDHKLIKGIILKRYKRFLVDCKLEDGTLITAHLANTGSMKTCYETNQKTLLSYHDNPKRKLKYSVELINNGRTWINVNTHKTNSLAIEAIRNGVITELANFDSLKPEVKVGNSRIDILLQTNHDKTFVEVKNVTLLGDDNFALFPDSVTQRGQKHLEELIQIKKNGDRAVMLFIVNREDVNKFSIASAIDPLYAELIKKALHAGVEILAYQCKLTPQNVRVEKQLEVVI